MAGRDAYPERNARPDPHGERTAHLQAVPRVPEEDIRMLTKSLPERVGFRHFAQKPSDRPRPKVAGSTIIPYPQQFVNRQIAQI